MSDEKKGRYTVSMFMGDLNHFHIERVITKGILGYVEVPLGMLPTIIDDAFFSGISSPTSNSPWCLEVPHPGIGILSRNCSGPQGANGIRGWVRVRHMTNPLAGTTTSPGICVGIRKTRLKYRNWKPTSDAPLIERIQSPGAAKRRAKRLLKVATILLALGLFFTGTSQAQTVTSPTWDQELATARAQLAREGVTVAPHPPAHATETAHEHTLRWVLLGGEAAARIGDWASTSQAMRYKDNRFKEGLLPDGLAKSEPGLAAYEVGAWGAEAYISRRLARHHPKLAIAMDSVSLGMTGGMVIRDYDHLFNYHR